jgi:protein tyrosine phosphatase
VNSEYINAVYVDGFRVKDQFVATQFPLTSTVSDFWRLIAEKNVSLIVVLNEVDTHIEVCSCTDKYEISDRDLRRACSYVS